VLRPEQIEEYRRMTVAERLRLTIELTEFAKAALAALPPEERERRLRVILEQKRASNDALLRGLAAAAEREQSARADPSPKPQREPN
jgi:hypothetical protein